MGHDRPGLGEARAAASESGASFTLYDEQPNGDPSSRVPIVCSFPKYSDTLNGLVGWGGRQRKEKTPSDAWTRLNTLMLGRYFR